MPLAAILARFVKQKRARRLARRTPPAPPPTAAHTATEDSPAPDSQAPGSQAPVAAIDGKLQAAVALHKQGKLAQAEAAYREILQVCPRHFDALHYLGLVLLQQGRTQAGVDLIRHAVGIDPNQVPAWSNLATGLLQLGRHTEALECYQRALRIQPDSIELYHRLSDALLDLHWHDEALRTCQHGLRIRPDAVRLLHNGGTALLLLHRYDEAIAQFDRVLQQDPDAADTLNNRGVALAALGRHLEALAGYERALAQRPDFADALNNRAIALTALNRNSEALASCERALMLRPDFADAHNNRGNALRNLQRFDEALASYEQALRCQPGFQEALKNHGAVLFVLGRFAQAAASYADLLRIAPDEDYAFGSLFSCRLRCCDWSEYAQLKEHLVRMVRGGKKAATPFALLNASESPADQQRCASIYADDLFPASRTPLWQGERYAHDKIRVAYLSADFHNHATAYLMAGLFEAHDKQRFQIVAISFGQEAQDEMRARLQCAFHRFVDVREKSDREVAQLLREMEIDIAVDLKGYTFGNRTGILAHRAAPIQVNYLGYPGTMGSGYIDYILADRHIIPECEQQYYTEKVVYLPDSYQVTDAKRCIAERTPARSQAGLPDAGFVFCSFNNNYKITPAVFDIWMRLLQKVPGSVLWLLEDNRVAAANLRRAAQARGVDPGRLVFAPRLEQGEHLARMRLADLFLDTLPVNAHTTASDALWAGLPVLTCTGNAFPGRVACSLLHAIGLPELVTQNLEQYEALALHLATSPSALQEIRARLADNRISHPLFDTVRFCRHIETAYVHMWERHRRGEAPAAFAIPAR